MFLKRIKKKVRGTAESAVAYPRITLYVDLLFCIIILPLTILLVPVDKWFGNSACFCSDAGHISLPTLFRLPQSEYSITVHA